MSKPRDIVDVYDKIISVIPNENYEFKNELTKYINSLWNKAPEVRCGAETFIPFENILLKFIPNILNLKENDPRWQFNVLDIYNGEPTLEEEMQLIFENENKRDNDYDIAFQKSVNQSK